MRRGRRCWDRSRGSNRRQRLNVWRSLRKWKRRGLAWFWLSLWFRERFRLHSWWTRDIRRRQRTGVWFPDLPHLDR